MNGDTVETTAEVEEKVGDLKQRLAKEVEVPAICQRLVLHGAPLKQIFERSAPFHTSSLEEILQKLEKMMFHEVKAFSKPPQQALKTIIMILQLFAASSVELPRLAGKTPAWNSGDWTSCNWKDCVRMLGDFHSFCENLRRLIQDAVSGGLQETQVSAARSSFEELGGLDSPDYLRRVSALCEILCTFARELFKLRDDAQQSLHPTDAEEVRGSVELRDALPLGVFCEEAPAEGGHRLTLALLTDLERAFQALRGDVLSSRGPLEAIKAVGELGTKCPERAIPALCRCFNNYLGEAALESLKRVTGPSAESLSLFLDACPGFRFYGNEYAVKAAMYLGPGSSEVLAGVVQGLVHHGNGRTYLDAFAELLPAADHSKVVDLLLEAMFREEHVTSDGIGEALKLLKVTDGPCRAKALSQQGLLAYLDPSRPPWAITRASTWAAFLLQGEEEDEAVVSVVSAALDHVHGDYLLEVAKSVLAISSSSRPRVLGALCNELQQENFPRFRVRLLQQIRELAPADDPTILPKLLAYVARAEDMIKAHGDWSSADAVRILHHVDQTSRDFFTKASRRLMRILVRFINAAGSYSLHEEAARQLRKLAADCGGVEHEVLLEVSKGFRRQNDLVRKRCRATYLALAKREPARSVRLLLDIVQGDEPDWSRQVALSLLDPSVHGAGALQPEDAEDLRRALLKVLQEPVTLLRCAALSCLKPFAHDDTVREAALKCFEDGDSFVQAEAFKLLMEGPALPQTCLARGLRSPDFEIVLLALEASERAADGAENRQEELAACLSPLLQHHDEDVAERSARALKSLTGRGKPVAIAALSTHGIWPERRRFVLEARQEALLSLSGGT